MWRALSNVRIVPSTVQLNTVKFNTVHYSTVQYRSVHKQILPLLLFGEVKLVKGEREYMQTHSNTQKKNTKQKYHW